MQPLASVRRATSKTVPATQDTSGPRHLLVTLPASNALLIHTTTKWASLLFRIVQHAPATQRPRMPLQARDGVHASAFVAISGAWVTQTVRCVRFARQTHMARTLLPRPRTGADRARGTHQCQEAQGSVLWTASAMPDSQGRVEVPVHTALRALIRHWWARLRALPARMAHTLPPWVRLMWAAALLVHQIRRRLWEVCLPKVARATLDSLDRKADPVLFRHNAMTQICHKFLRWAKQIDPVSAGPQRGPWVSNRL